MVYRPFRQFGRFGLAACAVSLAAASLSAQSAPSTTAPVGPNPSRVDIFMGYSYFGAHGMVKPANISYSSVNLGATVSGAYYFSKYVGGEVNFVAHPDGNNDGLYSVSGGLIARAPMENFTLFAHGLVGAGDLVGPNSDVTATFEHEPYRWGPTLTAGGGMDYDLPFFDHRFSLRLFEADYRYYHADFGPATTVPTGGVLGGRANLSGIDLETGIVAHFGHIIPPPPVTYSCAVAPASIFPGDPVTATGTALNLNPKKTATYTWSSTGGTVSGTSSTANVDTKGIAPGSYTVKGHVSEGAKPGQFADCSADFTVKAFEPPTISCSASPTTVDMGGSSTISASGNSPQNRALTYSYSASAGSISGTSSSATLATSGVQGGTTITVTCNVVDDLGKSATAMTSVRINQPPPPPAAPKPTTQNLCSVSFERDKQRPTRVDNEGKACLDDLALALQRSTDATLDVIGNATSAETAPPKHAKKNAKPASFAAERAVNTKDYLVKEKGIDASRVKVLTGSDDAKTVTTVLVPAGADTSAISATPVDESAVKVQPRKALPAKKHKK
jgi:ribosomal protein S11